MTLMEAVKATYAVVGQEMTDLQLAVLVDDLQAYPVEEVCHALARCRKECRRLVLADILDRLPNGHPGVEEAWGIVCRVMGDEAVSVVWTDEMRGAYGSARALADDLVAARMAFKEVYVKLINEARLQRAKPLWSVSLGYDPAGRQEVLEEAVRKNQISGSSAAKLLPHREMTADEQALVDAVLHNKTWPEKNTVPPSDPV
jgi:hypothetical protein